MNRSITGADPVVVVKPIRVTGDMRPGKKDRFVVMASKTLESGPFYPYEIEGETRKISRNLL